MTAAWASHIIAQKLNGLLCKECGVLMGSAGRGVPRTCDACLAGIAEERIVNAAEAERVKLEADRTCTICGAKLRNARGLQQHMRVVHSWTENQRLLS